MMEEEESEIQTLTSKEEQKHKASMLLLLLLLLRRKPRRSEFTKEFSSGVLKMRKDVSVSTAKYLKSESKPIVSKEGVASISKNMIDRVGSIISNSVVKLTPAEIVKLLTPSIEKIVVSEVFQTHNSVYVNVIKDTKKSGYFMHSAMLDACSICRGLHGTKYPLDSSPVVNVHPNCRCILIFVEG